MLMLRVAIYSVMLPRIDQEILRLCICAAVIGFHGMAPKKRRGLTLSI